MQNRFKFTSARIARLSNSTGKNQEFVWDTELPNFGMYVTPSQKKTYIYEGSLHGKSIRVKIGDPKDWSLGDARKKVTECQRYIDQGIDPREVYKARRLKIAADKSEKIKRAMTFETAWTEYIESRKPIWSDRHFNDHSRMVSRGGIKKKRGDGFTEPGCLAYFLHLSLVEISSEHIQSWLTKESSKRPTVTALAYRQLRAFINWLSEHDSYNGLISTDIVSQRKITQLVPRSKPKNQCLQKEQLKSWYQAISTINNKCIRNYLLVVLLTGARRDEVLSLQWSNIDFEWETILLKDKIDETRVIPLTPYVSDLIDELPRNNKWVFSSRTSSSGRLTDPNSALTRVMSESKLPHFTIHDLRRSFSTLSEWVELPRGITDQIMGHKPSATAEKHYKKRPVDLLRLWHTKLEEWILDQAGVELPNKGDLEGHINENT